VEEQSLRAYQRRTLAADALIASCYLAGTNTRRVRRALSALFAGAVGKDTVSRVWRKVKSDWDAWNARSLAEEPIVRSILDGTVVRVRLNRKATAISLLASSVCARTARRSCWQSRRWAAKAPKLGVPCSTVSSGVGCGGPNSSSSTAPVGHRSLQKCEVVRSQTWDAAPRN
jgi:transposase-like protein